MEITEYLQTNAALIDGYLDRVLISSEAPRTLIEALRYGVLGGGKKIRASLVFAAGEAFSLNPESLLPIGAAIEMIHSFSLVHDDLPCMDNDDFRRGKPSLHRAYGEAMGVLAGDGLLVEGLNQVVGNRDLLARFGPDTVLDITRVLLAALGVTGMVGGQVLDMAFEGRSVEESEVREMYRMKTGCFIEASILCGAIAGNGTAEERAVLARFGSLIGLCFQIVDDLLDVTQESDQLGKTAGKDQVQQKATLLSLYGMEKTRTLLQHTYGQARSTLTALSRPARTLLDLAAFIVERQQ